MPRRAARFGATTLACVCATVLVPAAALGSELIGRNATNVRLQVDAKGHALVSFRSGGSARTVVAWGAVDAREPSRTQPQVAFSLTVGGAIGPNVCGTYRGPPLAWRVAACTAPDGTHWAVQAWQRTLPNYGAPPSAETGARELHLSHWSGPLPVLEIATGLVVPSLPPPLRPTDVPRQAGLRIPLDAVRRSPRRVRTEHLRRHARLGVRRRLEAREQLPRAQPGRDVLLRLLPARGEGNRPGHALSRDRDRTGRRPRRHVAGPGAGRVRSGTGTRRRTPRNARSSQATGSARSTEREPPG